MHWFNCILQGLLTGLILSLMLGTVFFSLIKNSINSGYRTGIYIAAGVVICDMVFIALALLSTGFAHFLETQQVLISRLGGGILIAMSINMFVHSKPKADIGSTFQSSGKNILYFIGNGFLLNALNPVNFFSWLTISTLLKVKLQYNLNDQIAYFSACLLSIFIVEIGIAYFASRLKKWMTDKIVQRINQISALVFAVVGIKLLFGL